VSLYQKYRPSNFDEMVGNTNVVDNLRGLLAKDDPPHAFLFQGPTGCGKTTLGRIVAIELGCNEVDFKEIDTADFRGIDTARQIRHNAHYKALQGDRRAWLVDEAHKLTNDAQNALLKGLEDPPDHCYFILCTTEPEKLLDTIKGRCSIHIVKPLTVPEMVRLLGKICAKEKQPLSKKVLDAIARKSSISMVDSDDRAACYPRHALQLLEKVMVASPEEQLKLIEETESIATSSDFLAVAMIKRQGWKAVANVISNIPEENVEQVRRGVLNYCKTMLLKEGNDVTAEIINQFSTPFFDSGLSGLTLACYTVVTKGP
jgi:DNA polymerase III delta prime subunit